MGCNDTANDQRAARVEESLAQTEQDQNEAMDKERAGARFTKAEKSLICPCPDDAEGAPAVIGVSLACSAKENGLDGGDVRYFFFSFRRPGDNRYHHFAVPITPKDCKPQENGQPQLGDGAEELAGNTWNAISDASLRGIPQSYAADENTPEGEITPGGSGIDIGWQYKQGKLDAMVIKFESVCCVNAGSDVGKVATTVFIFPWKKKKRKGRGTVVVTKPPRGRGHRIGTPKSRTGKYGKWQYPDGGWKWLPSPVDYSGTAPRPAAIHLMPEGPESLEFEEYLGHRRRRRFGHTRSFVSSTWTPGPHSIPFPVITTSPVRQAAAIAFALRRSGLFDRVIAIGSAVQFELAPSRQYSGFGVSFGDACSALEQEFPWEVSLQGDDPAEATPKPPPVHAREDLEPDYVRLEPRMAAGVRDVSAAPRMQVFERSLWPKP